MDDELEGVEKELERVERRMAKMAERTEEVKEREKEGGTKRRNDPFEGNHKVCRIPKLPKAGRALRSFGTQNIASRADCRIHLRSLRFAQKTVRLKSSHLQQPARVNRHRRLVTKPDSGLSFPRLLSYSGRDVQDLSPHTRAVTW